MRVAYINGDSQYGCDVTFFKVSKSEDAIPSLCDILLERFNMYGYYDETIPDDCNDVTLKNWINERLHKDMGYFNDDHTQEIYLYISVQKDEEWENHFKYISESYKPPGLKIKFIDLTKT